MSAPAGTDELTAASPRTLTSRLIDFTDIAYRSPVLGPLIALILACVIFAIATSTFFTVERLREMGDLGMGYAILDFAEAAYDHSGIEMFAKEVAPALAD